MDNSHQHALTMRLKDGRQLAYAEYGRPDGFPLMLLHGTPGCRLWFTDNDETALALGLRLIAPDRPGFGLSDRKQGRTILDWPDDVAELAEQLGLEKFSVMGVSGGGIYAAACAHKLPHKLAAVALVSATAPFERGKTPPGMCRPNKLAFFLSRNIPWLMRLLFKQQKKIIDKDPAHYIEALQKQVSHLCEEDKKIIQCKETAQGMLLQLKGALQQGVEEAAAEPALLSRYWGFDCADITIPVQLWHGTADTLAPAAEAKKLEALLPHCTAHYIKDGGHFIIENNAVWFDLLSNMIPQEARQLSEQP